MNTISYAAKSLFITERQNYYILVVFLLLMSILSSCTAITEDIAYVKPSYLYSENPQSEYGKLVYAYLSLDKAIANNDKEKVAESTDKILKNDPKALPLLDVATWYFISGHLDDAKKLLYSMIEKDPDNFNNRLLLGEILIEQNDPDKAIYIIQDYIDTHPENTNALVDLAVLYINLNQLDKANEIFNSFSEEQKTPITRYYYAQSLKALGYTEMARNELIQAVEEQEDFVEAIRELAILEEDNNNIAEAIAYYNDLLKYDEINLDIITRLIRLNYLNEDYDAAYEISKQTHDPLAFMLSVIPILMDEGDFAKAKSALEYIKSIDAHYEEIIFYEAALAYENTQDIPFALSRLYEVPKDSKNYYQALRLIIDLEVIENMYSEALMHALDALETFQEDKDLFVIALRLFIALEQDEEALNFAMVNADKMISDNNNSEYASEVIFYYAGLLVSNDRGHESIPYFERIFQINPTHYEAMNSLAYYYAISDMNLDEALELVNTALEHNPDAAHILDTLAWVQYRKGEHDVAYEVIRKAIAIQQEQGQVDATLLEHYGFIALEIGHEEIAIDAFEDALLGEPENPDQILKALEKLQN